MRSTHHRNDSRDKHRNRTDSLDKNQDRTMPIQGNTRQIVSTQQTKISRTSCIEAKIETIRIKGILDLFVSSFIVEKKTADKKSTLVINPVIRNRILGDKALFTRIRETVKPMVLGTISSKTHSVTLLSLWTIKSFFKRMQSMFQLQTHRIFPP